MKKVNVAIVDDHEIFRKGLKFLLSKIEETILVGEAANGIEFLTLIKNKKVDIAFMDITMPELDGIAATEEAIKQQPHLKIIALTGHDKTHYLKSMLYAGVEGYMLKDCGIKEFRKAIDKVSTGESYFSAKILDKMTKDFLLEKEKPKKNKLPDFSKREKEVLQHICEGLTTKEIADKLNISKRTVEGHRASLIAKTNTKNTVDLVIYAFKNQAIEINQP